MIDFSINAMSAKANAAIAWFVDRIFELSSPAGFAIGCVLILAALQLRSMVVRRREMRDVEQDMKDIRAANLAVKSELESTKRRVAEATLAIATKSDTYEKKITSELYLLENLVREFAANTAARAHALQAQIAPKSDTSWRTAIETSDASMLEITRRALEENRVDLYLQPVVSLPQRKTRYYEAFSRLRSEDGTVIMPAQFMGIAAPAGLMSVVDNLLLFRCVQIVRRLAHKNRDVAVFCNISSHTLSDTEFFPQFLDFMHHHRDLGGQIIFEFSQSAVLAAGSMEEANLRYLANLGFRLSMDQVTDLDVDFSRARKLGFQFLKLRAETLLSGMKQAHAAVAAEDFKNLLSRNGLNLIIERVEDEKTVVQLLEFNVDFGQGFLFGTPRLIRDMDEANDPRANLSIAAAPMPPELTRRFAG